MTASRSRVCWERHMRHSCFSQSFSLFLWGNVSSKVIYAERRISLHFLFDWTSHPLSLRSLERPSVCVGQKEIVSLSVLLSASFRVPHSETLWVLISHLILLTLFLSRQTSSESRWKWEAMCFSSVPTSVQARHPTVIRVSQAHIRSLTVCIYFTRCFLSCNSVITS